LGVRLAGPCSILASIINSTTLSDSVADVWYDRLDSCYRSQSCTSPVWRHRSVYLSSRARLHDAGTDRVGLQLVVQPSLDTIREVLAAAVTSPNPPNLVPVFSSIPAEFLTPSSIYLKVSAK
jgi:hypothetical protein